MLDVVQTVVAHVASLLSMTEDATHDLDLSVRESVVNAIRHGNQADGQKRVGVHFLLSAQSLEVAVTDEGPGFDPDSVPDPLAPENLLRASGRGIFFMRSFMDTVSYDFPAKGGTVVKMVKRLR
jgi:serine/threonine-protein kinase RsbW